MAEYIEREAALKELNKNSITKKLTLANGVSIFDTIKNIPTADVVEVVRCKDCKHYEIGKSYTPYCNNVMNLFEEMKPTDFCSYGKRKEGEENEP